MSGPNEQMPLPDAAAEADGASAGARLRAARERKGMSVVEAADALRVDPVLVEALERDDYAALGAPVFAKGHLRRYAMLTGESIDELLLLYHQRAGVQEVLPLVTPGTTPAPLRPPREFPAALLLVVLVAAGAAGLWWWYEQPVERPVPIGSRGADVVAASDEGTQARSASSWRAEAIEAPVSESQDAGTFTDVVADEPSTAGPAGTDVPGETAPTAVPPATTSILPAGAQDPSASTPGTADAGAEGQHALALTFTGDSWVEVRDATGARLYYGLGTAGMSRSLRGTPPFEISLGRYADVIVELNGERQTIPPEAIRGNTARFTISPTGTASAR